MEQHARINLNTGETWEAGTSPSELIERQISDASEMLDTAASNRDVFQAMGALMCMGERLIQVVRNQQAQIDAIIAAHPYGAELEEWRREKRLKGAYKEGGL